MNLAMMTAAKRHGELVAHLSPKRGMLCKAHMMRIGRCATADRTWLFAHEMQMLSIANSARFWVAKFALVDLRDLSLSPQLTSFDLVAIANLAGAFDFHKLPFECLFDLFGVSRKQSTLDCKHPMGRRCGCIA
jgi:hypothetical protein